MIPTTVVLSLLFVMSCLQTNYLTVGGGLEGADPLADTSCSEEPMSPTDMPATLLHSLASPPSLENDKRTEHSTGNGSSRGWDRVLYRICAAYV